MSFSFHLFSDAVTVSGPHHISNNMIVPVLSSVQSQNSKHNKDHGPSVDQRAHRWTAASAAAAGVEA